MIINQKLSNYFVHETILEDFNYDKQNNTIILKLKYNEWQKEECENKIKGISLLFKNISNEELDNVFLRLNDYILDIIVRRNSVIVVFDIDEYEQISFNAKELTIVENY